MKTHPNSTEHPTCGQGGGAIQKWIIAIVVVVVLVGGLAGIKKWQFAEGAKQQEAFVMPPEAITTTVVAAQKWPMVLAAVGTVKPVNGLVISADLPGNVATINFDSGAKVKKGDLLLQQDISEEQALLRGAEAAKRLAELNLQRFKGLLDKRVAAQSDYDQSAAEYIKSDARSQEIRALIEKKTIRAPFDGVAGIRKVNAGQYLQAGDKIVPLQSMSPVYVNFSLPQHDLPLVTPGGTVRVLPSESDGAGIEGKVTAIDSVVEETTRNFLVQATVENTDARLRPGMFVRVEVVLPGDRNVLAIPSTAISYAPYMDSVYVVTESPDPKTGKPAASVSKRPVRLGEARGDLVEVLSGLKAGEVVATSGIFKLRPGAAVQVDNAILPGESTSPKNEDR